MNTSLLSFLMAFGLMAFGRHCLMALSLCVLLTFSLYAQNVAPELRIALGEQQVRFAPTRSFQEMQLTVTNHVGETVYALTTSDAETNWNLRAGNGETLAPGLYSYALTVQYAEDFTYRHIGHVIFEQGSDQVWLTAQNGAEVSGTALNVARAGGRSVAGFRTTEDKSVKRTVEGRDLVDEKGKPLTADKKAKQEKAALSGTQNRVAKFDAGGVNLIDSAMTDTGHVTIDSSTNMQAVGLGSLVIEGQSNKERVELRSAGATPGPALQGKGFGGTIAAPSATVANTDLFIIAGSGHNSTGLVTFNAGTIKIKAEQTWTPSANGSYINFETTPSNSPTAARAERMRITGNGNVGIGTTAPNTPLEVNGLLRSTRNGAAAQYIQLWGGDSAFIKLTAQSNVAAEKPLLIQNLSGEVNPGINNNIQFQVGTTAAPDTKMIIKKDGSVGIGTLEPITQLEVVSTTSDAIYGFSSIGVGVRGISNSSTATALYASNQGGGLAGSFDGNVFVNGTINKAAVGFKIDHPLDPANKYLYHTGIESPDMMNLYNGNVTTDENGEATVTLPEWFEALNRDFRYQLTVIGAFAQAMVANKIKHNRFTIKTDKPQVEVSWQVTGIRQDAYANAHRMPIEEGKAEKERGYYLRPELFEQPEEQGVEWARNPEQMKQQKEQREKAARTQSNPAAARSNDR